ncbi:type II toxin-antitoxin system tRNA(fMet)-specific endonuclease VapC [Nitrosomonas aestuarii]|uniref:type II toxin-antitoxin system tRNA(fMet)-specific endonuclease VapC n=1 Tax=Nitrosomonas aestuarii TaxID=52441 RepID=UPI000D31445B|nr:tRNA(fMet)-specific endonuclease VapC [Nitrosomonas aestuarii]PTN08430.1 tRNA(fMet)-specific endonuclease VapC [Nitrosomonas aestuarii]
MLKFMFDTSIVIYVIKRRPVEILETFNRHVGQMCISSITLTELIHGAEKSTRKEHNLRQVEDFTSRLEVLAYGTKAAAHYGDILADLEGKGTMIGVNDLHIAGHARSEGLTLATNNCREFEHVSALRIDNWVESNKGA